MLTVEAPAVFVLILQSVPPLLMENILTLALVLFLAGPLIAHVKLLLDNSLKTIAADVPNQQANRTVTIRYPTSMNPDSNSNSDLNIQFAAMRTTFSTPNVKLSIENFHEKLTNKLGENDLEEKYKNIIEKMFAKDDKTCLLLERSSPFVATNLQLPIVDISEFDYDSYRYELIKRLLKTRYGKYQAPGNVVLNSIHLSSMESRTGIRLNDQYSHSLFDFMEEYYDATKTMSRKEKEYLHPLDHFLVKAVDKNNEKQNTSTETNKSITEIDEVPEMIAFRDASPLSPKRTNHRTDPRIASPRSLPKTSSQTSSTETPGSRACSRKSLTIPEARQLDDPTTKSYPSTLVVTPDDKPKKQRKVLPSPETLKAKKLGNATLPRRPRSNESRRTVTGSRLINDSASSVEQNESSIGGSMTPGETQPTDYYDALSNKRFVKITTTSLSSTGGRTAGQTCMARPKSTGGRFTSDVSVASGTSFYGKPIDGDTTTSISVVNRPRTANAASRKRLSTTSNETKTVLSSDDREPVKRDENCQQNVHRKSSLGFRQSKQSTRLNDKKLSGASFVVSSSRLPATQRNYSSNEKSSVKHDNPGSGNIGVAKCSSVIRTLDNRPGSISRLPIYVGPDKGMTKNSIEEPSKELVKKSSDNMVDCKISSDRDNTKDCKGTKISQQSYSSLVSNVRVVGASVEDTSTSNTRGCTSDVKKMKETGRESDGNTDGTGSRPFLRAHSGRYAAGLGSKVFGKGQRTKRTLESSTKKPEKDSDEPYEIYN